jgi:serine/threonine protein kinase
VAVKRLTAGAPAGALCRLRHEAEVLSRLDHPGIVPLLDVIEPAGGAPALVMPWAAGGSVAGALAVHGPLAPATAALVVALAAEAVDAAHCAGVLHLDVKASNLLRPGHDGRLWVSDFGASRLAGERGPVLSGTPGHVAPEVADGAPPSPAADVFGLGVTLAELAGALPPALAAVAGRATASLPADRYPTAGALATALRAVVLAAPGPGGLGGTAGSRRVAEPAADTVELGPLEDGRRRPLARDATIHESR